VNHSDRSKIFGRPLEEKLQESVRPLQCCVASKTPAVKQAVHEFNQRLRQKTHDIHNFFQPKNQIPTPEAQNQTPPNSQQTEQGKNMKPLRDQTRDKTNTKAKIQPSPRGQHDHINLTQCPIPPPIMMPQREPWRGEQGHNGQTTKQKQYTQTQKQQHNSHWTTILNQVFCTQQIFLLHRINTA
jgi:hypothetical protein